jgi:energy-coupling factor transporter transmembrane protein EcfT
MRRRLVWALICMAVLGAVFFSPPWWIGMLAILLAYLLLPATVLAGLLYHRGYWRALFVGMTPLAFTAIPSVLTMAMTGGLNIGISLPGYDWEHDQLWETLLVKLYYTPPLAACIVCGLVAVGARMFAKAAQRSPLQIAAIATDAPPSS